MASYKVPHLEKNNPKSQDNTDSHPAGKKLSKKGPVGTAGRNWLKMGQYYVFATKKAYVRQSDASRLRNSLSVQNWWGHTWSALSTSELPKAKQTWSYSKQDKKEPQSQHLSHKERLKELGLFWLVKYSFRVLWSVYINTWRENAKQMKPGSFLWC